VLEGHELDFQLAKAVVKAKTPGCFHYLVTSFFFPPVRKKRTSLHPPVLRPEILEARPEDGEHLLVYQTSESNRELPEVLRASGHECRIYGLRRDLEEEVVDGTLRFRPFSERRFIEDLRTAKGVVANGGFTLLSEAVHLHKPVLSSPVKKQFEQILNARYIEKEGYGLCAEELGRERLGEFLERLPEFGRNLATGGSSGRSISSCRARCSPGAIPSRTRSSDSGVFRNPHRREPRSVGSRSAGAWPPPDRIQRGTRPRATRSCRPGAAARFGRDA
jgi:hypothetical protein